MPKKFLSSANASQRSKKKFSPQEIEKLAASGKIIGAKKGQHEKWVVPQDEFDKYLQRHKSDKWQRKISKTINWFSNLKKRPLVIALGIIVSLM